MEQKLTLNSEDPKHSLLPLLQATVYECILMHLTKKPFWKGPGLYHSALGNTWSNLGYADKPVIQILQLYFPPPFTPYLEGTVQCCSVHSQPIPVAICYVLRAYHLFVSAFINVTVFTVLMSCTLFPYHSFKMCPCLQSSRQALLSHIALVIELPCATKVNGGKEHLLPDDVWEKNPG